MDPPPPAHARATTYLPTHTFGTTLHVRQCLFAYTHFWYNFYMYVLPGAGRHHSTPAGLPGVAVSLVCPGWSKRMASCSSVHLPRLCMLSQFTKITFNSLAVFLSDL